LAAALGKTAFKDDSNVSGDKKRPLPLPLRAIGTCPK
jgi:hypothetical protein